MLHVLKSILENVYKKSLKRLMSGMLRVSGIILVINL